MEKQGEDMEMSDSDKNWDNDMKDHSSFPLKRH